MTCPRCGTECWRDEVDVGVGVMYGPWGCPCGWSESAEYDVSGGHKMQGRHRVDQWGGLTPMWSYLDDDPARVVEGGATQ